MEVENAGDEAASLATWVIAVRSSAGSDRTYTVPSGTVVPARGWLIMDRASFRLALVNADAVVELRDPRGAVVDSVAYGRAPDGASYARMFAGEWSWSGTPTPGAANVITTPDVLVARASRTIAATRTASLVPVRAQTTVRGAVTAAPGSVGSQIFYVSDGAGGIQVFFGKRAIPALRVGDQVVITGELREANGQPRIGIARAEDVRIVGHASELPSTPLRVQAASADDIGALVTIEGEVTELRGRTAAVDDGSDEIAVAFPPRAPPVGAAFTTGDTIRASGILSRTASGYRVLVRSDADVVRLDGMSSAPRAETGVPLPVREDVEVAVLGGSGALAAASLWRRRRILLLALGGIRRLAWFSRGRT